MTSTISSNESSKHYPVMTHANGITLMTRANGIILMTHTNVFHFRSCVHVLSFTYWQIRLEIPTFCNGNAICGISRNTLRVFKSPPKLEARDTTPCRLFTQGADQWLFLLEVPVKCRALYKMRVVQSNRINVDLKKCLQFLCFFSIFPPVK